MTNISKPSRVDRACDRLDTVLSRLEQLIDTKVASGGATGNADTSGEIERLRAENTKLAATNNAVKGRLDTAIQRLETILGPTS